MPRSKWIDKKSATTFSLVYRPQNDPLIHDDLANSMVLKEVPSANKKIKTRDVLEDELGIDVTTIRDNEGEAANYGIFYDDTGYDYMQHMRDIGGAADAYFLEAPKSQKQKKSEKKDKQKLEEALRDSVPEESEKDDQQYSGGVLLDDAIMPSKSLTHRTYQDQQDVPDSLAGFQPDMDPRLREVLEALDDEAYVEDEEEIFTQLADGGEVISLEEFEEANFDREETGEHDEDEGWESDDTAKPRNEYQTAKDIKNLSPDQDSAGKAEGDAGDPSWLVEFAKFKTAASSKKPIDKLAASNPVASIMTGGSSMVSCRQKKRKGARTSTTSYSMTSSALFRTEGLTLLDDRFDKIEEEYAADEDQTDDGASVASSMASQKGAIRPDFDSIMDEFLGGYSMSGKKNVKRGAYQTGIEQLDEIRQGLGPARLKAAGIKQGA
ncbi:MAG: hypothetical protein M1829_001761 [Trizodia sp. TS-e1964]|nr:MAG: hypothetical protein M1829_001761 [Trizodia sp. TS-e1964]